LLIQERPLACHLMKWHPSWDLLPGVLCWRRLLIQERPLVCHLMEWHPRAPESFSCIGW